VGTAIGRTVTGSTAVVVAPIDALAAVVIAGTTGDEKGGNFVSSPESDVRWLGLGATPPWVTVNAPITTKAPPPITAAISLVREFMVILPFRNFPQTNYAEASALDDPADFFAFIICRPEPMK
jgi:hypothetical protein